MPAQRVYLISHSDVIYSTRRLMEAGKRLGLRMLRVDPTRVYLDLGPPGRGVLEDGEPYACPDVVVTRVGSRLSRWTLSLLELWMDEGARTALSPEAIRRAGDKVRASLALRRAGLPIVPTVVLREPFHADDALETLAARVGEEAWVIKSQSGSGGTGVTLTHGRASARSVLGALTQDGSAVLLQPQVALRRVRDLRILVAAYEPLAAYWRVAQGDEFRANVHRGGRVEKLPLSQLDPAIAALAVAGCKALEMPFGGVDLVEYEGGFAILEINASPGFQGAEEAHGTDLVSPYLERWVAWGATEVGSG